MAQYQTSTIARGVSTVPELVESLQWFAELLPATAKAELHDAQAAGSLLDPVTVVDGKRNVPVDAVKPFGKIVYVDSLGPLRQAIAAASAFLGSWAPRDTGFYQGALRWFANGRPVGGLPNAERVGLAGNVQLVDLAPYASTLEIDVPRGVIYAAYTFLNRTYAGRLNINFSYRQASLFGGFIERPDNPAVRPYAVPVLTMGNPGSTVRDGARRPAGQRGKRRRRAGE